MISVILLAAGASSRMGSQDKLALEFKGEAMLLHIIRQLLAAEIEELVVIRRSASDDFLPTDLKGQIQIAVNPNPERGMTSSIQAGLLLVSSAATGIMIALADMPLLQTADYDVIIQSFQQQLSQQAALITVPFHLEQKGNPVIFSKAYRSALAQNPHPEGARNIIRDNWDQLQRIEMDSRRVLVDVDTPEDWERMRSDLFSR